MRALIVLGASLLCSASYCQKELLESPLPQKRIEGLIAVRTQAADIRLSSKLLDLLRDKDKGVRLAALETWGVVAREYEREVRDDTYELNQEKKPILRTIKRWQEDLTSRMSDCLNSPDKDIRDSALVTLCKFGRSLEEMMGLPGCGVGSSSLDGISYGELYSLWPKRRKDIEVLANHPDASVARTALQMVQVHEPAKIRNIFRKHYDSKDVRFRGLAIWLLQFEPWNVRLRYTAPLLSDPVLEVRQCAQTFLKIPKYQLRILVSKEFPTELRRLAVYGIAELFSDYFNQLLPSLLLDPSEQVRLAAIQCSGGRHPLTQSWLEEIWLHGRSSQSRIEAFSILFRKPHPRAMEFMLQALESSDQSIRAIGINAFDSLGSPRDLADCVVRAIEKGVPSPWRAAPDLSAPGSFNWVEYCLTSEKTDLRRLAAYYATRANQVHELYLLIRLAQDPDPDVATIAIGTLAGFRHEDATAVLIALAQSKEPSIRKEVAKALEDSAFPETNQLLQKMAQDPDRSVRVAAKEALYQRKSRKISSSSLNKSLLSG